MGTGCATCKKLHEITKLAASEIDAKLDVEYVSGQDGMKRLMGLGLMQSPALVVNDKVAMVGFNPNIKDIKSHILDNA